MLIVAGTTIGAGMLALPIASAGLGFNTALALIIGCWLLMTYTALLMLELHQFAPRDATLNTLAKKWLGKRGQWLANFAVMFLFYALCAAYIAGGGSQLQARINEGLNITIAPQLGSIILAIVIASVVTLGTSKVDKFNRILFSIKIVVLASLFYMLTPHVHGQHLLEMPVEKGLILAALPVIFTSFGFHGSIPSIVKYVGLEINTLRKVMIAGAAVPLVIYIFWQVLSQGIMSQTQLLESNGLSGFIANISSITNNPSVSTAVNLFADLALATSFLGVSLGLFDFFADTFKKADTHTARIQTALITFIPPLGFALFYPQGFIMALGYAAIALVILAVFLPVSMVYRQRKSSIKMGYKVRSGNIGLVTAGVCGILIISAQCLQMAGIISSIG